MYQFLIKLRIGFLVYNYSILPEQKYVYAEPPIWYNQKTKRSIVGILIPLSNI